MQTLQIVLDCIKQMVLLVYIAHVTSFVRYRPE